MNPKIVQKGCGRDSSRDTYPKMAHLFCPSDPKTGQNWANPNPNFDPNPDPILGSLQRFQIT